MDDPFMVATKTTQEVNKVHELAIIIRRPGPEGYHKDSCRNLLCFKWISTDFYIVMNIL